MTDETKEYIERMEIIRKKMFFPKFTLARILGISYVTMMNIYKGNTGISCSTMQKICKFIKEYSTKEDA